MPGKVRASNRRHYLAGILTKCAEYLLPTALLIIAGLGLACGIQGSSTQISHTLGNGFTLTDDSIRTSAIVRNYSPISVPYVELPYSYGAQIMEGKAACELNLTEGIVPCGSRTAWLGMISPGERKNGEVIIHPNHANFTIIFSAQLWIFSYPFEVASTIAHCSTNDGARYGCRAGTEELPGETAYVRFYQLFVASGVVGAVLTALLTVIWRRRQRDAETEG